MNSMLIILAAMGGNWSFWIMMILIFVVMYLFMIRPQQKKQKEIEEKRKAMKAGDRVVTAGGIHGKIDKIQEDTIMVEVAKGVIIKMDKASIFADQTPEKEEKKDPAAVEAEAADAKKKSIKKSILSVSLLVVFAVVGLWLGGMFKGIGLKSPIPAFNTEAADTTDTQVADEETIEAEISAETPAEAEVTEEAEK